MKSKILVLLLFVAFEALSQTNTFPSTGNVGIGLTSPAYILDISSTLPYVRLHSSVYTNNPGSLTKKGGFIFNQENGDKTAGLSFAVPPGYYTPGILFSTKTAWNAPGSGATDWYDRMFIHPNGNIGMGNTNPFNTLHVTGSMRLDGNTTLPTNATASDANNYANKYNFKLISGNSGLYIAVSNVTNDRKTYIQSGHEDQNYAYGMGPIVLNPFGGNVGIGTTTVSPDAKLTVAGDIHTREVRVTVNAGADFVFGDKYDLRPLSEVEKFIKENKHLPEVQSAEEMEEDGLELGKMDIKLLQKIEELTLYMIDLKKEVDVLKEENEKLKKAVGVKKD